MRLTTQLTVEYAFIAGIIMVTWAKDGAELSGALLSQVTSQHTSKGVYCPRYTATKNGEWMAVNLYHGSQWIIHNSEVPSGSEQMH